MILMEGIRALTQNGAGYAAERTAERSRLVPGSQKERFSR